MEIVGSIFRLRPWCGGDVDALVRYANNYNVWRNLSNVFPFPYTDEVARKWVDSCRDRAPNDVRLAIEIGREAVGGIGYRIKDDVRVRTGEIGYWLGEPFWGRGIATEALRLLTARAFEAHDLLRMQACVFSWNLASARVLEKAGFELEARLRHSIYKDGQVADELIYSRLREDGPPREAT